MSAWIEIGAEKSEAYSAYSVALHMSAWIEMSGNIRGRPEYDVALHVSAWIEIRTKNGEKSPSLIVALHVSAWIEIVFPCL
ncbi:hypothetical protein [Paenibacillus terrae]|uniref:Uncharacterized protein n=1 Tax=Paenibacillus terrae TaxID=159743 RepID=A0A0D7X5B6_9BACL|nr:hypothetical protein [Paenibacillus terrae]KJD45227.1 hypothetical protein QD47_12535 [Paenibacillus terrae]